MTTGLGTLASEDLLKQVLDEIGHLSKGWPRFVSDTQADLTGADGKRLRVGVSGKSIVAYRPDGPGPRLETCTYLLAVEAIGRRLSDKRTANAATKDYVRFDRIASQANRDARYMIVNGYDYRGRATDWDRVDRLIAKEAEYAEKRAAAAERLMDLGEW
jgi:hypothetical protein